MAMRMILTAQLLCVGIRVRSLGLTMEHAQCQAKRQARKSAAGSERLVMASRALAWMPVSRSES